MADNKNDGRSQNQPSHEAQVKGGQHSHQGGSQQGGTQQGGTNNPPNREEASKGGQHSHSGSGNR